MQALKALSRRRFFSLGLAAWVAAVVPLAQPASAAFYRGYISKTASGYVFSKHRYHCDYCYLGDTQQVFKISPGARVVEGPAILSGSLGGRRLLCVAV